MAVSINQTRQTPSIEIRTTKVIAVLFRSGPNGINADYERSMNFLASKGLLSVHQMLAGKYGEADAAGRALALLEANPKIKSFINKNGTEYGWFYTGGIGIEKYGRHTFDENGKLTKVQGDKEKTVYIWEGTNPLSISVCCDNIDNWRYYINADDRPWYPAPVVVGFKPNQAEVNTSGQENSGGVKSASTNPITHQMVTGADGSLTYLETEISAFEGGIEKGVNVDKETAGSLRKFVEAVKSLLRK
jgi:hypothetical protein